MDCLNFLDFGTLFVDFVALPYKVYIEKQSFNFRIETPNAAFLPTAAVQVLHRVDVKFKNLHININNNNTCVKFTQMAR